MVMPANAKTLKELVRRFFGGDLFGEGHGEVLDDRIPKPDPRYGGRVRRRRNRPS